MRSQRECVFLSEIKAVKKQGWIKYVTIPIHYCRRHPVTSEPVDIHVEPDSPDLECLGRGLQCSAHWPFNSNANTALEASLSPKVSHQVISVPETALQMTCILDASKSCSALWVVITVIHVPHVKLVSNWYRELAVSPLWAPLISGIFALQREC